MLNVLLTSDQQVGGGGGGRRAHGSAVAGTGSPQELGG